MLDVMLAKGICSLSHVHVQRKEIAVLLSLPLSLVIGTFTVGGF